MLSMKRRGSDFGAEHDTGVKRNAIGNENALYWASNSRFSSSILVAYSESVPGSSFQNRFTSRSSQVAAATLEPVEMDMDDPPDDDEDGQMESMTLRQWLSRPGRWVDRIANLHIFKQIVEFVELAHTQGVILRTIRPSCFIVSPLHRVSFIESSNSDKSSELSADAEADPGQADGVDIENISSYSELPAAAAEATGTQRSNRRSDSSWEPSEQSSQEVVEPFPLRQVLAKEQNWYLSPEEVAGGSSSFASDIYSLGVLFFELFCSFASEGEWSRAMSDLRHRILPPRLLSESPKEAALCLWLLHPEPQSRPKSREVLQCELLIEAGEALAELQAAVDIEDRESDSALLLDFLLRVQHQKEEAAHKLCQEVNALSTDINEVEKRRSQLQPKGLQIGGSSEIFGLEMQEITNDISQQSEQRQQQQQQQKKKSNLGKRPREEYLQTNGERFAATTSTAVVEGKRHDEVISRSTRLMTNFDKLEQAYFSMRWKVGSEEEDDDDDDDDDTVVMGTGNLLCCKKAIKSPSSSAAATTTSSTTTSHDRLGTFFDSLCKYARYSRFQVKATLRHGDLLNTANMVCSLSFDRDEDFFATAGVCKKIKVFECDSVLNEHVDIHYPVVEMTSRSKLSSICWNSYIKSHLASSDYDGVIQLWDVNTSQALFEYKEHEKRAWTVDFSHADPTKLASGSDDGCVKLWSINQEASIGTIKTKANVCCVQFPTESAHLIVFGSADYKIYGYDLRNTKVPLCILASHNKAVSYVRFVDAVTLVSASTDSTLKLWDLTKPFHTNACCLTYSGHTNEKNFVGLSVADGYIACGSETNTVFAYHKSLPMPLATHKFGSTDPISGEESEDDGGQFVSSVCWRGKSQTLVAANSMGNIKLLDLV